ncbi:hypothetical protein ACFY5J_07040 [Peribacillus butanolivorans]
MEKFDNLGFKLLCFLPIRKGFKARLNQDKPKKTIIQQILLLIVLLSG